MKRVLIEIFKLFLKIIYFFMKLFKTKNKIVYISRQSNEINIDFKLISDLIEKKDNSIKQVFLCKRMNNPILYFFEILKQIYHLATSKVCVIDSYIIPVCILKHKKNLYILQIWHSIGKIKKSGYQSLDTPGGRSSKIAKAMCMHQNYDNIIAGSKAFAKFYEQGFNVKKDVLLHYGLPRIDYLIANEDNIRKRIYLKYPNLKNKKIVYYVPTFRKYEPYGIYELYDKYNPKDVIIIVRAHPTQKFDCDNKKLYNIEGFSNVELLSVADYVITDYSSICLEAAIINKKVLFYTYDHDKYLSENGINLDFYNLYPSLSSKNINDIFKIITTDSYDDKKYQEFRKKYLPKDLGKSTEKIVNLILSKTR